jgi:hypothetical protein
MPIRLLCLCLLFHCRFVAGAGSAVEKLVLQLMGTELATKLVPIPGITPTQLQVPQQQQQQMHHLQHAQQQQQQLGVAQPSGGQVAGLQQQLPPQLVQLPMQQPGQQQQQPQTLAGLFGGNIAAMPGFTQAQLAQLQQNQLAQQLQQNQLAQQLRQQQAAAGQQFVPGPQHLQGMGLPTRHA